MEKRRAELFWEFAVSEKLTVGSLGVALDIIERMERGENFDQIAMTYASLSDVLC